MRKYAGCAAWAAIVMATAWPSLPARAADDAPIPVEAFYRQADIGEIALSPSGRKLAVATGRTGGRTALAVFDLHNGNDVKVVAQYHDVDVDGFRWVNDELLVYDVTDRTRGGGDQQFAQGLFSVKADGSETRQLIRLHTYVANVRGSVHELLDWNHGLLAVPETGGTEVIVGRRQYDARRDLVSVAPILLDVVTRRTRSLGLDAPERATQWWFDPTGEARAAAATHEGRTTLHWRAPGQNAWKELASFPMLAPTFWPASVDGAGQLFVTTVNGPAGYRVLKRFDFATGQPESQALVSVPGFDFSGSVVGEYGGNGRALGVRVWTDAQTTHWFDARLKKAQQAADTRLPGRVNQLSCRRCDSDDMTVLVRSWSDQEPGELWVYRPAKDDWQPVGRVRSDIDPKRMATLDLHRIKARDGLELPVWVTLPRGASKKSPKPAVVLVHGGPWVRGSWWRWDADAQFLASRGYVVVAPEFRGSLGYGDKHFRASFKQWGLAMQDDVADALNWAVAQGWVDAGKVCIAGASYGGYATLAGLFRHPELYRCGIAWAAVTDPRLLFEPSWMNDISREAQRYGMPVVIGDPVADAAALAAIAPTEQAARIKAPVLLAFGGQDTRVPLEHGDRMRAALRKAGQEPEWVVYPEEWHGWYKAETRYDFARRMENFLAKHLK